MKLRCLCLLLALCALAACAPRSTAPVSSSEPAPVQSAAPAQEETTVPESFPEESASSAADEPEPEEEFPIPILTDTEKSMLAENLALFAQFIGPSPISDAAALPADLILAASLAEIERTKDINAYFFEQDDDGNDLIPVNLVADMAWRLFGVETFSHKESDRYLSEQDCYLGKPVEITAVTASDLQGAPDDCIAYVVSFPEGDCLYTGKIMRQNGMPYLRFVSSQLTF